MTTPLDAWVSRVCDALALDATVVDRDLILDLARDAAHGVARPAAPLTTFLAGLAAGRDGADAAAVVRAARTVTELLPNSSSREG